MGDSPTAWAAPPSQKTSRGRGSESAPSHVSGSGTTLTHPSAGATGRRRKNSHSRATLQQNSHTEVRGAIRPTSLDFGKRVGWLGGQVHARKCVEVAPSLLCNMVLGDHLDDAQSVPRELFAGKDAPLQNVQENSPAGGRWPECVGVGGSIRL